MKMVTGKTLQQNVQHKNVINDGQMIISFIMKKDRTEQNHVVIFSKLSEIAGEYLIKSSPVYIEGQLQTREQQDQSGQDKYTTEIVNKYEMSNLSA